MSLSGPEWVNQFPESTSTDDLVEPFQGNANRFLAALNAAGATVSIACTLRPRERAYLMHYSFRIARQNLDPGTVPAMAGVDIQWVHTDAASAPDLAASRNAAEQMVQAYGIVFQPALSSRHTEGKAIDMDISWQGNLTIDNAGGQQVNITTQPRTGAGNTALHQVGATYNVRKLASDPPHWSSDGH
jgi:hypothetical protein